MSLSVESSHSRPHVARGVLEAAATPETVIDGRRCLYFAGSGYLGLQGRPEIAAAACDAALRYGVGSGTSRAAFGSQPPTLEVDRRAARFLGADAALYSPNGYMANLTLLAALAPEFDLLAIDQHAHDSLQRGARLCGKPVAAFAHRDPASLLEIMARNPQSPPRALVISDGVFSVLGTLAPVRDYVDIVKGFPGSAVLLDDAHALGVLGASGRGSWEHAGFSPRQINQGPPGETSQPALYCSATLSKACGGYGGVIAGSSEFVEHLKSSSTFFAGSSPLPAPVAAASARAIQLIVDEPPLRRRLRANAALLRAELRKLGLGVPEAPTPVVPVVLESAERMRRVQEELAERGVVIAYFARYSGVGPEGALRIAVFATHTPQMIQRLVDELARLL